MTALNKFFDKYRQRVDSALDRWLPGGDVAPDRLHTAMRYSILGGGKRLRPILVYAAGQAVGVETSTLDGPACAVELIHTYSLVHDDLPSMDDDDLRRGKPTCHCAFDEATAVLVGDALQVLAFEILARDDSLAVNPEQRIGMIVELAAASGTHFPFLSTQFPTPHSASHWSRAAVSVLAAPEQAEIRTRSSEAIAIM